MNEKSKFLAELRRLIQMLPEAEVSAAIEFFDNYISDADDENAAIKSLGSVRVLASDIVADYTLQAAKMSSGTQDGENIKEPLQNVSIGIKRRGARRIWPLAVFAVFAAPIALPVAIAVGAVLLSAAVTIAAVCLSFVVTGIALIPAGVIYTGIGVYAFATNVPFAILTLGTGIFAIGFGYILLKFTIWAGKLCLLGINKLASRFLLRVSKKHRPVITEDVGNAMPINNNGGNN